MHSMVIMYFSTTNCYLATDLLLLKLIYTSVGINCQLTVGDGGGGNCLVRMEWRPSGWSVCLPLLIFPCTIKSRSSLLAPAHPGGPGKRAVKRLWWWLELTVRRHTWMDTNVNVSFSAITLWWLSNRHSTFAMEGQWELVRALLNGANAPLILNGCSVLDMDQRGVTKSMCEHVKDLEIQVLQSRDWMDPRHRHPSRHRRWQTSTRNPTEGSSVASSPDTSTQLMTETHIIMPIL